MLNDPSEPLKRRRDALAAPTQMSRFIIVCTERIGYQLVDVAWTVWANY